MSTWGPNTDSAMTTVTVLDKTLGPRPRHHHQHPAEKSWWVQSNLVGYSAASPECRGRSSSLVLLTPGLMDSNRHVIWPLSQEHCSSILPGVCVRRECRGDAETKGLRQSSGMYKPKASSHTLSWAHRLAESGLRPHQDPLL